MIARGKLGGLAVAALAAGIAFAGCKEKESLVVVTLTTMSGDTTLTSARISVGTHSETFSLTPGVGVPYDGVSFGLYVPSGLSGPQPITVTASQGQTADCNAGTGTVDITTVGQTYGPIAIALSPSSGGCSTGSGGTGGSTGGGITSCTEYDHGNAGDCKNTNCTNDATIDWAVYGAVFSPVNPSLAVTSASDGRTKVWTVKNGTLVPGQVIPGGTGYGLVAFSPDGTLLAIGQQGGVDIVDVSTWTTLRTLMVSDMVYGVAFSPDGTQVITLDTDESTTPPTSHVYVHAVANTTPLDSATVSNGWAMGVSPVASPAGLPVVVTTQTGTASVFMLTATGFSAPTVLTVTSDQSTAETAQFSPNGSLLAAGGDDSMLQFWPFPLTGSTQPPSIDVSTVTNGGSIWVNVVAFSPDGTQLAIGGGGYGSVTTYSTASRAHIGVEQDTSSGYEVYSLGYSPDGKYIIGGEADCGCVFLCH